MNRRNWLILWSLHQLVGLGAQTRLILPNQPYDILAVRVHTRLSAQQQITFSDLSRANELGFRFEPSCHQPNFWGLVLESTVSYEPELFSLLGLGWQLMISGWSTS